MIDKNSAPRRSHNTADKKNEKTRLTAERTGFDDVITFKHVMISNKLNMKNIINSIFIAYSHFYPLILLSRIDHLSLEDLFYS